VDRFPTQLYGFVSLISGLATIWIICCITVERAWVIFCIIHAKHHRISMLKMRILVCIVWTLAAIFSLPPLFGWNRYVYEGYLYSSSIDYLALDEASVSYTWILLVVGWLTPNFIILSSHALVICLYKKNNIEMFKNNRKQDETQQSYKTKRLLDEQRLWCRSFLMITVWLLSWTPYATIFLMSVMGYNHLFSLHGHMIPAVICKLSTAVNPVIYGLRLPSFRRKLRKLFGKKIDRGQPLTSHQCLYPNSQHRISIRVGRNIEMVNL